MTVGGEWESLARTWRTAAAVVDPLPLRRIVAAHRRRLLLVSAGEVALVLVLAWLTYAVLARGIAGWKVVWTITLWSFVAVAFAFVLWNRRGTWRAMGASVSEFVRLTRLRAERQLQSLRFGVGLFIGEAMTVVVQLLWFDRFSGLAAALMLLSAAAVVVWYRIIRRRIARDLAVAAEYQDE